MCWTKRDECFTLEKSLSQGSHSDWKTWKNGKAFSSQGKVREFWTDWKSRGKSHKILENWDKYYLIFLVIFKWILHYLLKWIKFSVKKNKTLKKYWKNGKNTGKVRGKSGNFVSPEKWEACVKDCFLLKNMVWMFIHFVVVKGEFRPGHLFQWFLQFNSLKADWSPMS